ncbi:branched-chain amino acid ABC transporter permease [Nonomuraea sp. KC401]|uniref:branched-chain amino acid ABC transporter permease n=1 Tax=unclassified Nonomuraea TaxID=2593643 RepID=UPI0010FE85AB|nr:MULTISPECIES: branched-chain amino acid ABC transporter permease [unclassified Nonomuraea]NBE97831.1 branched-chain amino acid ABC transporter permease [Nonomuraea sp. K271]TLF63052.1 branched-chain amino acid ABC transporter permease [Nonomuraea sp. KC401]
MIRLVAGLLIAAVTLALPSVLDESALPVYILLGLAAMVTVGVSLLMGYAGQVSLGQGAFYAIGAYTAALLALNGVPPLAGLIAAPVVAALSALVIGTPLLRLRGHHLAFATLAMQLILLSLAGQLEFTGGDIGLQAIPQFSIGSWEAEGATTYAYLTWAGVALVMLVTHNVITSRPGRALRALATSETAAASSGIPVGRYKLTVFALSAAFAGLAGGIYCFYTGYVAPGSFPVLMSIQYIVMAVVGGLGTTWGAVIGASAITLLLQGLNTLSSLPGMPTYAPSVLSYAVYALLLIVVVLFLPQGLLPAVTDRLVRRRKEPSVKTR